MKIQCKTHFLKLLFVITSLHFYSHHISFSPPKYKMKVIKCNFGAFEIVVNEIYRAEYEYYKELLQKN